ncbi:uroporphyrinogen decarboxylase family protein [Vallitalea guaymasensis]|uniref:uroporphyrinogen decarboxylase family protein n=1 Tax=Vallitalea guaymasensis TaxID=1185412 RepID=UPI002352E0C6|nr:uroporphyrinogen decarboxylase family protein [Vallitalea guaymasensis]
MTKKDNLISLIKRQGYEEAPVYFDLCPSLIEKYKEETKSDKSYQEYFDMPWRCIEDRKLINHDTEKYRSYYNFQLKEGTYIDEWGVAHEPGSEAAMHMTYMRHPMKDLTTLEELEAYPFPDFANADHAHQKAQCDEYHVKGLAAMGNMQCTVWELSWYMRSMEQLMMDMITAPEKAAFILDRVTELSIIRAVSFVKAGADMLFFGDDVGMQNSIMLSEDMYVTWLKPRLKKIIDTVREINPNIIIFYHSCGFITPFIPHLIDVGVDVLNPVQPECMSFDEIHKKYNDKISFYGTIGTQTTMPFGTPSEIKEEVTKNLTLAGKKGGLICAPTHLLEPEVPWENILAYVNACKNFKPI